MLNDFVKNFERLTGLAELYQTVIVTFAEDNYRIELFKDSDPKNGTPFHIRVYDQVLVQTDGDEAETEENSMIVGVWRELLHAPEVKSSTAEDCLRQAIKTLSEMQTAGDD
jgi:hypothetical protein